MVTAFRYLSSFQKQLEKSYGKNNIAENFDKWLMWFIFPTSWAVVIRWFYNVKHKKYRHPKKKSGQLFHFLFIYLF